MTRKRKCCICGKTFTGCGNDPWPIKTDGRCCDACNDTEVIAARMMILTNNEGDRNQDK